MPYIKTINFLSLGTGSYRLYIYVCRDKTRASALRKIHAS